MSLWDSSSRSVGQKEKINIPRIVQQDYRIPSLGPCMTLRHPIKVCKPPLVLIRLWISTKSNPWQNRTKTCGFLIITTIPRSDSELPLPKVTLWLFSLAYFVATVKQPCWRRLRTSKTELRATDWNQVSTIVTYKPEKFLKCWNFECLQS